MEPKVRFRLETGPSGEACRTGIDPSRPLACRTSVARTGHSSDRCPIRQVKPATPSQDRCEQRRECRRPHRVQLALMGCTRPTRLAFRATLAARRASTAASGHAASPRCNQNAAEAADPWRGSLAHRLVSGPERVSETPRELAQVDSALFFCGFALVLLPPLVKAIERHRIHLVLQACSLHEMPRGVFDSRKAAVRLHHIDHEIHTVCLRNIDAPPYVFEKRRLYPCGRCLVDFLQFNKREL